MFDLALDTPNVMPSRYRQVTIATVASLDARDLEEYFTGHEAYRRTRFVVARCQDRQVLVELARGDGDALFSLPTGARVLASEHECVWVRDPRLDCGIASHLVLAWQRHPDARCVVVEGRYEHVSFLLNPAPLEIEVVDVVPPLESKLVDQVRRVLDFAEDIPPLAIRPVLVDSRELLAAAAPECEEVLVPCRGGGVELDGVDISYLDERPERRDWALLGCQRSQQIHRWFYGEPAAVQVDFCPREILDPGTTGARLSRCCLRESGIERHDSTVLVPWGASLDEVRRGLELLVATQGVAWTRT